MSCCKELVGALTGHKAYQARNYWVGIWTDQVGIDDTIGYLLQAENPGRNLEWTAFALGVFLQ